MTYNLKTEGEH